MVVTEVGWMGVKPGLDVMDDDTREGQILTGVLKTIIPAPGGPQRIYWGTEIEDPSKIWAFFDWKSVEEHREFAKSFGEEAVKDLPLVLSHGEFSKHLALTPFPPLVLQSSITEVILAFFPADITPAAKDSTAAQFQKFTEINRAEWSDATTRASGWGVENDFPVRGDTNGQRGSVFVAYFGWPNINAHAQFQKTDAYKQHIESIKGLHGLLGLSTFHLSCRTLVRGEQERPQLDTPR